MRRRRRRRALKRPLGRGTKTSPAYWKRPARRYKELQCEVARLTHAKPGSERHYQRSHGQLSCTATHPTLPTCPLLSPHLAARVSGAVLSLVQPSLVLPIHAADECGDRLCVGRERAYTEVDGLGAEPSCLDGG